MPRYTVGGVQWHTDDSGGAVNIGAITNLSVPENLETSGDDAGLLYEYSRSIVTHMPVPTFTSKHIAAVLNLIGLGGTCINSSPPTTPGVRLYGRRQADCKDNPGSSTNAMHTVTDGLAILGSLTAERGQDATISVEIHALTDGTNAPVVSVYNQSLPTFANAQFTLGESMVAGIRVPESSGVTIEFGCTISDKTPALGFVWPDTVAVRRVMPKIRVRGFDLAQIASGSLNPAGFSCTHVNTIIQLIKRENKGTFVAAGTSEHIAISMDGMGSVQTRMDASGNSDATQEVQIEAMHDGTNVPILWDTTSTYDSNLAA